MFECCWWITLIFIATIVVLSRKNGSDSLGCLRPRLCARSLDGFEERWLWRYLLHHNLVVFHFVITEWYFVSTLSDFSVLCCYWEVWRDSQFAGKEGFKSDRGKVSQVLQGHERKGKPICEWWHRWVLNCAVIFIISLLICIVLLHRWIGRVCDRHLEWNVETTVLVYASWQSLWEAEEEGCSDLRVEIRYWFFDMFISTCLL